MKRSFLPHLFSCLILAHTALFAAETTPSWQNRLRVHVLHTVDQFLEWSLDENICSYPLKDPMRGQTVQIQLPELIEFEKKHGYLSLDHPLVGSVSADKEDIATTSNLLIAIDRGIKNTPERFLATGEILTKVLAYRDLSVGMEIPIPSPLYEEGKATPLYRVDKVFDLWHGMPAFGLVPLDASQGSPILLYRGTDFSLITERSWASVISDLDIRKAGFTVFQNARPAIHDWLTKVKGAQIMGYSLGGALAAYTVIYEHEWISKQPSIAFNPAGISQAAFEKWYTLPAASKNAFMTYVTQGDPASNSGRLCGLIGAFRADKPLSPITSHVSLITANFRFRINHVEQPTY